MKYEILSEMSVLFESDQYQDVGRRLADEIRNHPEKSFFVTDGDKIIVTYHDRKAFLFVEYPTEFYEEQYVIYAQAERAVRGNKPENFWDVLADWLGLGR